MKIYSRNSKISIGLENLKQLLEQGLEHKEKAKRFAKNKKDCRNKK